MDPRDPSLPQAPKGTGVFTLGEVAPFIGVSKSHLYRLAKKNQLPFRFIKIGNMIRVPRHMLHDYMREIGLLGPETVPYDVYPEIPRDEDEPDYPGFQRPPAPLRGPI